MAAAGGWILHTRYVAGVFDPELTYPARVAARDRRRHIRGARARAAGLEVTTRVRLRRIDAPELHARCAREYLKAEAARSACSESSRQAA